MFPVLFLVFAKLFFVYPVLFFMFLVLPELFFVFPVLFLVFPELFFVFLCSQNCTLCTQMNLITAHKSFPTPQITRPLLVVRRKIASHFCALYLLIAKSQIKTTGCVCTFICWSPKSRLKQQAARALVVRYELDTCFRGRTLLSSFLRKTYSPKQHLIKWRTEKYLLLGDMNAVC